MGAWLEKLGKWRASPHVARAVEFACLAPALALLLLGAVSWGGYFALSRHVQAAANDALAAALSEFDADARASRAQAAAERVLATRTGSASSAMRVSVVTEPRRLTVLLVYDASRAPVFALRRLMPLPSPLIVRSASEHVGA